MLVGKEFHQASAGAENCEKALALVMDNQISYGPGIFRKFFFLDHNALWGVYKERWSWIY